MTKEEIAKRLIEIGRKLKALDREIKQLIKTSKK